MSDLIKDLRAPYWDDGSQHKLMAKAADEIERNREAIAELVNALDGVMKYVYTTLATVDPGFYQIAIDEARAAITKHTTTTTKEQSK